MRKIILVAMTLAGLRPELSLAASCADALRVDFWGQWGTALLPLDDPAFRDPKYLSSLHELAAPQTVSYHGLGSTHYTSATALFKRFEELLAKTSSQYPIRPLRFANSGTDANKMLFEMAEVAYFARTGSPPTRINMLYLGEPYGGTYGRSAEFSLRYNTEEQYRRLFQIPAPITTDFGKHLTPDDFDLRLRETRALRFVRESLDNPQLQIGAIFLEPISASPRLYTFRPQFMAKLRRLADRLQVPIFADEILTGGGRTGKFWAFQHYPDFEPDLFTFGKGMVVSGVAEIDRGHSRGWNWPNVRRRGPGPIGLVRYPGMTGDGTSRVHPLPLLQSVQVIDRILAGNLTTSAARVGNYAVALMRQKGESVSWDARPLRGVGLLFYVGDTALPYRMIGPAQIKDFLGRWTPTLTTSESDFDRLLGY